MRIMSCLEVKMVEEPRPQRDRFIETARALGSDEDEAAFRAKLAVIAQERVTTSTAKPSKDNGQCQSEG